MVSVYKRTSSKVMCQLNKQTKMDMFWNHLHSLWEKTGWCCGFILVCLPATLTEASESKSTILACFYVFTYLLSLEQYSSIKSLLVFLFFTINYSPKQAYNKKFNTFMMSLGPWANKNKQRQPHSTSEISFAYQVVLFWLPEALAPGLQICSGCWHHLSSPALPQAALPVLQ